MNKLYSLRKKLLSVCLAAGVFFTSTAFAALPEILSIKDVKPGMTGKCYTVIDATGEIKSFDAKIIGIIEGSKMSMPRILADISGPVIDETGGALSGMSGSPMYIDGKLVGALSASFKEMHLNRIVFTPIEYMLPIWDYPDKKNKPRPSQVEAEKAQAELAKEQAKLEEEIAQVKKKLHSMNRKLHPEVDNPNLADNLRDDINWNPNLADNLKPGYKGPETSNVEEKAVFLCSGFSGAGLDFLKEKMAGLGIRVEKLEEGGLNTESTKVVSNAVLEPGSPVGASLVVGDFTLGSLGTVTAVDDKRILAFGHPFSQGGNVSMFMTGAKVLSTVHGPVSGMKLGSNTAIIGRINQDREAGIAGVLGQFPDTVPVTVKVRDRDTGDAITFESLIAYDEEILPGIAPAIIYNAMGKTVNRTLDGTADIHYTISTNMGKDGKLERHNLFYNAADVGKAAIAEFTDLMKLICTNKEKEADITEIQVNIGMENSRRTASLVSAVPSKQEVYPGEKLTFKVGIKPFREEKIFLEVPYTVPADQDPGVLKLDIHGGGLVNVTKLLQAQQQAQAEEENQESEQQSKVADILAELVDTNHNNDIVIETAARGVMTEKQQKEAIKNAKKRAKRAIAEAKAAEEKRLEDARAGRKTQVAAESEKQKHRFSRMSTNYIIDNVIHSGVKVLELKKK